MRRTIALLLAILALLGLTSPVLASRPVREFLPAPDNIDLAAGELCTFPVRLHVVVNEEYGITFFDAAGNPTRTNVAGRLVIDVINVDDPSQHILLNASGPAVVTYIGNIIHVKFEGRSLIFLPSEHLLYLNTGIVIEEGDGSIQPTVLPVISRNGHRTDLCPILAS
jgi:hypothetical protein